MPSPVGVGETVISDSSISSLGGKGLIQAIAIARAGQKIELVCGIGPDGATIPAFVDSFGVGSRACRTVAARSNSVGISLPLSNAHTCMPSVSQLRFLFINSQSSRIHRVLLTSFVNLRCSFAGYTHPHRAVHKAIRRRYVSGDDSNDPHSWNK